MTKLMVTFHNFVNVPNNQETFQRNSSVHSINERNKHHLHRPIATFYAFRKVHALCWHKIFNNLPLSLINYICMYACESLGYVVEKKIIAITQTVLSALFLPPHLNVNEAFHTDAQKHDIYHRQPNSIQHKKLVKTEVLLQTTHNPHSQ